MTYDPQTKRAAAVKGAPAMCCSAKRKPSPCGMLWDSLPPQP